MRANWYFYVSWTVSPDSVYLSEGKNSRIILQPEPKIDAINRVAFMERSTKTSVVLATACPVLAKSTGNDDH